MSRYDFIAKFRPGTRNSKADTQTRRSGKLPSEGEECLTNQIQTFWKLNNLEIITPTQAIVTLEHNFILESQIMGRMETDSFSCSILQAWNRMNIKHPQVLLAECNVHKKHLEVTGLIYVPGYDPLRFEIIGSNHDSPLTGHPTCSKCYELVSRNYWWPSLGKYFTHYVNDYQICTRSKATKHAPFGKPKPLEIPKHALYSIAIDFITDLLESQGSNTVLVVVDRLSKMGNYIHRKDTTTAADVPSLYLQIMWKLHNLDRDMVSDRRTKFTSHFSILVRKTLKIKSCMRYQLNDNNDNKLKIKRNLSTEFIPQPDRQMELQYASLEQSLGSYVDYRQDN